MRAIFIILTVSFTILSTPAFAKSDCEKLSREFDHFMKLRAMTNGEGITDNSAPRATMRAIETNNNLIQQQMVLELMKAGNCTLPETVIMPFGYVMAAMECHTAQLNARTSGSDEYKAKCDFTSWKKDVKK